VTTIPCHTRCAAASNDYCPDTLWLPRRADRALYLAKACGRNRVETLSETDPEPVELALA
jgi:hypothetical protein